MNWMWGIIGLSLFLIGIIIYIAVERRGKAVRTNELFNVLRNIEKNSPCDENPEVWVVSVGRGIIMQVNFSWRNSKIIVYFMSSGEVKVAGWEFHKTFLAKSDNCVAELTEFLTLLMQRDEGSIPVRDVVMENHGSNSDAGDVPTGSPKKSLIARSSRPQPGGA